MVDKLDTFAGRLKHLRKNAGLSLAAVAAQIGVSTQAVHKWENGGNIDPTKAILLAELFDVGPSWILYGAIPDDEREGFPARIFKGAYPVPSAPTISDSGIFVPLLDVKVVTKWLARTESAAHQAKTGMFDFHSGEWIACPKEHSDKCYALRVPDSSMENLGAKISYSQGDIIFVDPAITPWNESRMILTGHNMEEGQSVIFRQLVIEGWEMFRRPLNPEWHEQKVNIPEYELPAGTVIGKWVPE